MKVLFAVNNEKISEAIIKKYQVMYKEIISWKNVYFFNAIIKELQKDKSYDRIVIGEDLEPYASNNYDVIDNFLFDKLDSISDEASNSRDGNIPIILIATDRREKGNALLSKLLGIGIFNVLLGADRKIENVCKLINQPRIKKEAKDYYRVEADYKADEMNPDNVSELEIQNIIRHYKKLGKDEAKYVESFEEIATQYTDVQLKLITKFLPLNVRAVLEEKCPKYQQVMIASVKGRVPIQNKEEKQFTAKDINSTNVNKIDLIDKELKKAKLTKPVVIPSTINMQNVKKAYKNVEKAQLDDGIIQEDLSINENVNAIDSFMNENISDIKEFSNANNFDDLSNLNDIENPTKEISEQSIDNVKKGRGRPRKEKTPEELAEEEARAKKGRGRPKKVIEQEPSENILNEDKNNIDLFALGSDDTQNQLTDSITIDEETQENNILPGLEDEILLPGLDDSKKTEKDIPNKELFQNDISLSELPGMEDFKEEEYKNKKNQEYLEQQKLIKNENSYSNNANIKANSNNNSYTSDLTNSSNIYNSEKIENFNKDSQYSNMYSDPYGNTQIENINPISGPDDNLSQLITGDKKIVAFVGTSKNGTSFLVNNLAANLSSKGINTAILDLTKNKNAYYIYTSNEENLRKKSFKCIDALRSGIVDGIKVNKNLTVYTTLPGENKSFDDYGSILSTLAKNYSVILLDCDFETNPNYFANSQEIYLVQTYDILTIQPLTAFLNELKHKNILDQNKLKIVINKTLKLRKLTEQMIIGGISCYNDPASTYINTLFEKDKIRYTTIPFEDQTYARYLERLVDCEISLSGYSKLFLDALEKLSNMVYPLISGNSKYTPNRNYNDYGKKNTNTNNTTPFNNNMNATLNKMRNNF